MSDIMRGMWKDDHTQQNRAAALLEKEDLLIRLVPANARIRRFSAQ